MNKKIFYPLLIFILLPLLSGINYLPPEHIQLKDRAQLTPAYNYAENEQVKMLIEMFEKLPLVQRPSYKKLSNWKYAKGNASEGLQVTTEMMPEAGFEIKLRHRILAPNSPLWYHKKIKIDEPLVLKFGADDGAQVFINQQQKEFYKDKAYRVLIPATTDSVDIIIRVLNNAMLGGLNYVGVTSQKEFDQFLAAQAKRNQLEHLITKLRLMQKPPASAINTVKAALENNSKAAVDTAYRELKDYPHFTAGPYLQNMQHDAITILWETDVPSKATVRYGTNSNNLNKTKTINSNNLLNEVTMSDLQQGQTYYYQIDLNKSKSAIYSFQTASDKTKFQFAIWGDSQNGWLQFKQNIHAMLDYPIDFSVGVGDLVNNGGYEHKWYEFLHTAHPLISRVPTVLVPGNHDYDGFYNDLEPEYFKKYVRNPKRYNYFAWSYGNARFVTLDPNENFPLGIPEDSEQHQWLIKEIQSSEWQDATWHFILVHQPPYGKSWFGYHGEPYLRDILDPLIESAGIDFIISGHLHGYERLKRKVGDKTVYHVITAGGGGPMGEPTVSEFPQMDVVAEVFNFSHVEVNGNKIRFRTYKTDRQLLDEFELVK